MISKIKTMRSISAICLIVWLGLMSFNCHATQNPQSKTRNRNELSQPLSSRKVTSGPNPYVKNKQGTYVRTINERLVEGIPTVTNLTATSDAIYALPDFLPGAFYPSTSDIKNKSKLIPARGKYVPLTAVAPAQIGMKDLSFKQFCEHLTGKWEAEGTVSANAKQEVTLRFSGNLRETEVFASYRDRLQFGTLAPEASNHYAQEEESFWSKYERRPLQTYINSKAKHDVRLKLDIEKNNVQTILDMMDGNIRTQKRFDQIKRVVKIYNSANNGKPKLRFDQKKPLLETLTSMSDQAFLTGFWVSGFSGGDASFFITWEKNAVPGLNFGASQKEGLGEIEKPDVTLLKKFQTVFGGSAREFQYTAKASSFKNVCEYFDTYSLIGPKYYEYLLIRETYNEIFVPQKQTTLGGKLTCTLVTLRLQEIRTTQDMLFEKRQKLYREKPFLKEIQNQAARLGIDIPHDQIVRIEKQKFDSDLKGQKNKRPPLVIKQQLGDVQKQKFTLDAKVEPYPGESVEVKQRTLRRTQSEPALSETEKVEIPTFVDTSQSFVDTSQFL